MALLPILRWPDPRLSARCTAIAAAEDVSALVADMLETMYAAPGRGLAAPQVGVLKRIFVMDPGWKEGTPDPYICINPVLSVFSAELESGPEGCLSIPGITIEISRASSVTLGWTDLTGTPRQERLTGFAAICAQHEYDHLDGIVTFDRLSGEARALAESSYQP
jgi:peptide deformylase